MHASKILPISDSESVLTNFANCSFPVHVESNYVVAFLTKRLRLNCDFKIQIHLLAFVHRQQPTWMKCGDNLQCDSLCCTELLGTGFINAKTFIFYHPASSLISRIKSEGWNLIKVQLNKLQMSFPFFKFDCEVELMTLIYTKFQRKWWMKVSV